MVRDARVVTLVFVALLSVAALADARDTTVISRGSGIAYFNPTAAAGSISIVVRARSANDLDAIAVAVSRMGYTIEQRAPDPPALDVTPPAGVSLERAVKALAMQPGVAYAEPSYHIHLTDVPSAPLYATESTYLQAEHAPEAWEIEKGRASVVVAILDTGVDVTHPDLKGRIWTNPAEIGHNGVDDDGNGCIDDVHGCAFVSEPAPGCAAPSGGDVRDDLGHGTFVSSVVAASGSMVGVARGVTIMPVKVLDCTGAGGSFELARGILYAVKNGASLLNVSLGGAVDSAYLHEAIRIARDRYGVLLVASTGNSGGDVEYPARYPEVLSVGAESAMHPGQRASFSGAGPEVDVVAIGEGILGAVPKGRLPDLSDVCAERRRARDRLWYVVRRAAGHGARRAHALPQSLPAADQIINIVKATADPLRGGTPAAWAGAGRINMLRALIPQFRLGVPGATRS